MSAALKLPQTVYVDKILEDIMGNFVNNRLGDLSNIEKAVLSDDWDEAHRCAHLIAGVAGGYGFTHLGEESRLIEKYIETKDKQKILDLVQYLKSYMSTVTIVFVDK